MYINRSRAIALFRLRRKAHYGFQKGVALGRGVRGRTPKSFIIIEKLIFNSYYLEIHDQLVYPDTSTSNF